MTQAQEKALAFVEALTGWVDLGVENSTPKSPHALTHLMAKLGYAGVADGKDVIHAMKYARSDTVARIYHQRVDALADYLIWVGRTLKERP